MKYEKTFPSLNRICYATGALLFAFADPGKTLKLFEWIRLESHCLASDSVLSSSFHQLCPSCSILLSRWWQWREIYFSSATCRWDIWSDYDTNVRKLPWMAGLVVFACISFFFIYKKWSEPFFMIIVWKKIMMLLFNVIFEWNFLFLKGGKPVWPTSLHRHHSAQWSLWLLCCNLPLHQGEGLSLRSLLCKDLKDSIALTITSSLNMLLSLQLIYESGVSLRASFLFLSACSLIHMLRTLFLLPRKLIPYPLPDDYTYGYHCNKYTPTDLIPTFLCKLSFFSPHHIFVNMLFMIKCRRQDL